MENLPKWEGASEAYSKAYKILQKMALNGHARPAIAYCERGRRIQIEAGSVSNKMSNAIDALNLGDEEAIKSFILKHQ